MNANKKILLGTLVSTATIGIATATAVIVAKVTKTVYVAKDISPLLDEVESIDKQLSTYKEGLKLTFDGFFQKDGKPLVFAEIQSAKDFASAKKAADDINHDLYKLDTSNLAKPTTLTIAGETIKPGVFVPKSIKAKINILEPGGEATKSYPVPAIMLKQLINSLSDKELILKTIQQYTFNTKEISASNLNKIKNAQTIKEARGIAINFIKGKITRKKSKKMNTIITISGVFEKNTSTPKRFDLHKVVSNLQTIPNNTSIQGVIKPGNEGSPPQYLPSQTLPKIRSFNKEPIKLKDYINNLISKFKGLTDDKGWDLNLTNIKNSKTQEEALKAAKEIVPFVIKK